MAAPNGSLSDFNLTKPDFLSENVIKRGTATSRGKDVGSSIESSVEAIRDWIERIYSRKNEEGQEFRIICRTPVDSDKAAFEHFCESIKFDGKAVPLQESTTEAANISLDSDNNEDALETSNLDEILEIEVIIDIADTNGVSPPYTVSFEIDPEIVFETGSTNATHFFGNPELGKRVQNVNLFVSSTSGDFSASMTPPFLESGLPIVKDIMNGADPITFVSPANNPGFYTLTLTLGRDDIYLVSGSYTIVP